MASGVDQIKSEHAVDMTAVVGIVDILASEIVDTGKPVFIALGDAQHLLAFGIVQKFAPVIEQLQRVPLLGIM